jgi:AcrR family transcriptional regulator
MLAARECFAEGDAQMLDIAGRAGVGVGTVYRHFESKEALMEALALDCIGEVLQHARRGLDCEDPWAGFEQFVWGSTEKLAADALSVEAIAGPVESAEIEQRAAELSHTIVELADRALAAGALRSDLTGPQVDMILRHLGKAVRGGDLSGFDWRSYVRVVLDGLRADAPA